MFLVPSGDTTTIDDWFPTGMRATGSRTMMVDDVFVPGHRVQASPADLALQQRDNALVTRVALRSVQRLYSLAGAQAGNPEHPVSLAKRDIEMVSHHVTLTWRQSAVRYLAAATQQQTAP